MVSFDNVTPLKKQEKIGKKEKRKWALAIKYLMKMDCQGFNVRLWMEWVPWLKRFKY
jgi:hypothetical protein